MDSRSLSTVPRAWCAPAPLAWLLLPLVAVLAAYGSTLGDFFLSDDFAMLHRSVTAEGWLEASHLPRTGHMAWLRPISQWSWWGQVHLHGLDPLGFRLFNVLLHGLNAALVAWLTGAVLAGLGSRAVTRGGSAAGLAFALAPIHPEAVTWISGRVDVLCTTGVLVALLGFLRFAAPGGGRRHLLVACLGLGLGLGSKEMAVTVPGLALILWLALPTERDRRRLLGIGLLSVLVGGYLVSRFLVLDGLGGVSLEGGGTVQERFDLGHAVTFQGRGLRLALAPLHRNHHPGDPHLLRLVPLVGLGVLLVLGILRRGLSLRGLLLALVLFVASTAPIAGWAHVSDQNFMSTRYLYLPTVFSSVLVGVLFAGASVGSPGQRRPAAWALLAPGSLALVLAAFTYQLAEINGAWSRAAATTERMLTSLPSEGEVRRLCLTDLPDNDGGAYVARVGFSLAVELFTDRRAPITVLERGPWEETRRRNLERGARPEVFRRWDREGGWVVDP